MELCSSESILSVKIIKTNSSFLVKEDDSTISHLAKRGLQRVERTAGVIFRSKRELFLYSLYCFFPLPYHFKSYC